MRADVSCGAGLGTLAGQASKRYLIVLYGMKGRYVDGVFG